METHTSSTPTKLIHHQTKKYLLRDCAPFALHSEATAFLDKHNQTNTKLII